MTTDTKPVTIEEMDAAIEMLTTLSMPKAADLIRRLAAERDKYATALDHIAKHYGYSGAGQVALNARARAKLTEPTQWVR